MYPGEINDQQQSVWRKTLEVFDEQEQRCNWEEERVAETEPTDEPR